MSYKKYDFLTFICVVVGALFFWLIKGMKSKFDHEMSSYKDLDSQYYRNLIVGGIIIFCIISILIGYNQH